LKNLDDLESTKAENIRLTGECSAYASIFVLSDGKDYDGFMQFPLDPGVVETVLEAGEDKIQIGVDEVSDCYISYTPVRGQNVYPVGDSEVVSFEIPIINTLAPASKAMTEDIEDIVHKYNNFGNVLASADKVMNMARSICSINSVFMAIEDVYIAIKFSFSIFTDSPLPPLALIGVAGEEITGIQGLLVESTKQFLTKGVFNWFCAIVTCDNKKTKTVSGTPAFTFPGGFLPFLHEKAKNILGKAFGDKVAGSTYGVSGQAFEQGFPATPLELAKSHYVFSIAGLCLPGLVYNLNKMQQMECWRGKCYMELVPAGLPKSECDKQYAYQKCAYNSALLSSVIKWIGLDTITNAIRDIIENPLTYAWGGARIGLAFACNAAPVGKVLFFSTCTPYAAMNVVETTITARRTVENFISGFDWEKAGQPDYCAQLRDAIEEGEDWNNEIDTSSDENEGDGEIVDDGGN
jgi:hypothetical protein